MHAVEPSQGKPPVLITVLLRQLFVIGKPMGV
jgi:hypothetical protein